MVDSLFYSTTAIFPTFSPEHLLILAIIILNIVWLIRHPDQVKNPAIQSFLRIGLILTILIQQILLYSWYVMNNAFDVVDALPLYPCRISTLFLLILLIKMNRPLFHFTFYWGILGGTLALLSPDTNGLGFPNAMFIQFFMGHAALVIGVFFLAIVNDYRPTKKGLFATFGLSMLYFIFILFVNQFVGSNYAYLRELPQIELLAIFPAYPFHIPFFITFIFAAFFLIYKCFDWAEAVQQQIHKHKASTHGS